MNNNKAIAALLLAAVLAGCNSDASKQKDAAAYIERSEAYEAQGQYRAAMIEMRNAIQATPDNIDNIDNIIHYAEVLIKIGAVNQASTLLEPLAGNAHQVVLAEAFLKRGKHLSAKEALAKADSSSYRFEDAAILSAQTQFISGEQAPAIDKLRVLANSNEKAAIALTQLLIATGKTSEAQKIIQSKLSTKPTDTDYLLYSAQIAYLDGNLDAAEVLLNEVLLNSPETDMLINPKLSAIELLAKVLTGLGKTTESLVYNRVLQNENPDAFSARQQYQDAIKAAAQGDLETAKGAFEDILAQFPNNQQAALLLGLVNLEQGDVQLGEALLSGNIDAETAPVTLIQATALAQAEVGKTAEAFAVVERALLARPDDSSLLSLFGVIALNNNKTAEGVSALSKALQLDPSKTRLHLLLAQHYVREDQSELALGHLRKAYSTNPSDWATTSYFISALFNANEATEIAKIQQTLESDYAENSSAQLLVALIHQKNGDSKTAKGQLEKLHNDYKNNNRIATAYARLLSNLEEHNAAASVWLNALNNEPSNRGYLEQAVQAKSKTSSLEQTIAWLKQQKTKHSEAVLPIDAGIVQLLVSNNQASEALVLSKQYSTNSTPMAQQLKVTALTGAAIEKAKTQQLDAALTYAKQGLEIAPDNQQLTQLAAQFEARADSPEAALERLNNFIKTYDNHLLIANDKAKLLVAMGDEQQAFEFLSPLWQTKPNGQIAQLYLSLMQKFQPEDYSKAIDELLALEPNNPGANLLKGDLHLANGEDDEAKPHYLTAIAANANLVPALNNLAWLTAKTNPSEALGYSERASKLAPQSASVLDTHGWVLHLLGQQKAAVNTLEKALALEPENTAIQEHLATARL